MKEDLKIAVLQTCDDIIAAHQFRVEHKYGHWEEVDLVNERCILRFTNAEYGPLEVLFIDPVEKQQKEKIRRPDGLPASYSIYLLYGVWALFYPDLKDKDLYFSKLYDANDYKTGIKTYKKVISECLPNVINGDFSWTGAYEDNNRRIPKKIEYMAAHWDIDNPVRVSFWNGDPEWEKQFDEYKAYLDNLHQRQ